MNDRKPGRKRGNTADEQQAYRSKQKALGRPTSDVVAMAVFRCLVGHAAIKNNEDALFKIEDLVVQDLLSRYPGLSREGIEYRYESMTDELLRLHKQGLFEPRS